MKGKNERSWKQDSPSTPTGAAEHGNGGRGKAEGGSNATPWRRAGWLTNLTKDK